MISIKVVTICCSQCCGKGTVHQYEPHRSTPVVATCPQCNGQRTIKVLAPGDAEEENVVSAEGK